MLFEHSHVSTQKLACTHPHTHTHDTTTGEIAFDTQLRSNVGRDVYEYV